MRRAMMKGGGLWLLATLALASCKDDPLPPPVPETPELTACLDQPQEFAKASTGKLPCELLPPGLSLPQ